MPEQEATAAVTRDWKAHLDIVNFIFWSHIDTVTAFHTKKQYNFYLLYLSIYRWSPGYKQGTVGLFLNQICL